MKLIDYISFFHRQRTGQLSQEESGILPGDRQPQLDRELEEIWSESLSYQSGYEPDVDKGFSAFKARIKSDQSPEAKPKKLKVASSRPWISIAAAIALIAVLGSLWFVARDFGAQGLAYSTSTDEQIKVTLPDGSGVYLNEKSRLSYEQDRNKRIVTLMGEAYFEVTPNPDQPFVIHANGIRTTVLGTAFNLRAYPDERTVEVEVAEGRVRMEEPGAAKTIELQPMERGIFAAEEHTLRKKSVAELNAQGWHRHSMVFRDARLATALKEIGRYYKVDFKLKDPVLSDCALSTEINADPLSDFLKVLETIYGFEIREVAPEVYVLSDGRCR